MKFEMIDTCKKNIEPNHFLRRADAAQFLTNHGYKIAVATLEKYASTGCGPPFKLFGRFPIYSPADLLDWAESKCTGPFASTSDSAASNKA